MKEILLTSSALILALLILRRLFRKTLSRRVQYALWGLVLLRLLVPVSLPAAGFSLLTAAEPVESGIEGRSLYMEPSRITLRAPEGGTLGPYHYKEDPRIVVGPASEDNVYSYTNDRHVLHEVEYTWQVTLEDAFRCVWYVGCALMAGWLGLSNLLFWRKLRKRRVPYDLENARYPVYLVEDGLPSPCLFGLLRPAIYLTPAAVSTSESLRHVVTHEETHARHLDPLWSLLRGVCLSVYWFDPLVWWAALASRADCELACDEGALRRLGEAERIPYGRTLLALIPVRKTPGNLLLSATTMTADKRRLVDRVTRIAENRKNLGTALFAVVSLAALICAVTFTGAKAPPEEPRPLTQEELDYFNGEFFTEDYGRGKNLRRQFLTCIYSSPEHIDLYELLYNGTGLPEERTDTDRRFLEEILESAGPVEYVSIKISRDNIDTFILENTGISSQDLDPDSWGGFWWNEESGAYYHLYPDFAASSYYNLRLHPQPVTFTSGQREEDVVRLYYQGAVYSGSEPFRNGMIGPLCLTLREKAGGGWWFVSHEWDLTGRISAAPDWEPIDTIPLDGLEPYEPEAAERISLPADSDASDWKMLNDPADPSHILGDNVLLFYQDGEGRVFAGVQSKLLSSWPPAFWSFDTGVEGEYNASFFRDLMGHDGFCITCDGHTAGGVRSNDYFYVNEEGWPVRLAQIEGYPELIDLDGDGQKELVSQAVYDAVFYFRRDGKYYRADLDELLQASWRGFTLFTYEAWDAASRSLAFQADEISFSSIAGPGPEYRTLYFDGENLLVYNDQRRFADHIMGRYDIDGAIISAALDVVRQEFEAAGAPYDDWRITGFDGARILEAAGQAYRVWKVVYEFHSPEPREIQGSHARDCWAGPPYPEHTYLVFRDDSQDECGTALTYLFSMRQYLWPTAAQLPKRLAQVEELPGAAAVQVKMVLDDIMSASTVTMTLLAAEGGGSCQADPQIGSEWVSELMDQYEWTYAGDPGDMPATSLLLMDGSNSFRFWPDGDLVLFHTFREDTWLRAAPTPAGTPSVFYPMRAWYYLAAGSGVPTPEAPE